MSGQPWYTRQQIESALIDGHWRYGGLIHQKAADALVAALRNEASDRATGHALFSRLFGEYAASLETHGAWAWALRNRFARGSFLDAYLDYSNKDVSDFYALVKKHEDGVVDLLRLPSAERVAEVAQVSQPMFSAEGFQEGLDARYKRLKLAADLYFGNDRILIDTYNKTKHGAPMVTMLSPENPRRFEFVVPDRRATGSDRYRLSAFTLTKKLTDNLTQNIESMTTSITELASLTRLIDMFGLLYEKNES